MAFKNIDELAQAIASSGQSWSDADMDLARKNMDYGNSIFTLKNDWLKAKEKGDQTAMQDIHDRTEDFRKQYGGYYGGADGSGYVKDGTYFNHDDPYQSTLDSLADQLLNYQKYKSPYQDKLGEAAGRLEKYGEFENPYQGELDRLAGQLAANGQFTNPYQQQIDAAADKLGSYGEFQNPYQQQIDETAGKLSGYAPFENPYQQQLEGAANELENYKPYENPYQQQTDDVLNKYTGRGPFSYDLESDPIWQQYQKTYGREGQRAREDAVGNYSAATGGQMSTAAMTAASQAQDYYNAQMADKIPDLYQFAYERWLNEGDQYANQLSALRGLNADALNSWVANKGLIGDRVETWRELGSDARQDWASNLDLLAQQLASYQSLGSEARQDWNANLGLAQDQLNAYRGLGQDALNEWGANQDSILNQIGAYRGLGSDALNAWNANLGLLKDQMAAYQGADDSAYKEWSANLGLLNNQLSGIQGLSDNLYDRDYQKWSSDYQVGRDSINDTRYEDETAYNREQEALDRENQLKQQALAQALEWMQMGVKPDEAVGNAAGLTSKEIQDYVNAVQAQMLPKIGSSGGGSGRSSGGSSSTTGAANTGLTEAERYDALFRAAEASGNPKSYVSNHYKEYGFSSSSGLTSDYEKWAELPAGQQEVARSNVTNQSGSTWVHVPGMGRLSWNELERAIDKGEVSEYVGSDGKYRYVKVR